MKRSLLIIAIAVVVCVALPAALGYAYYQGSDASKGMKSSSQPKAYESIETVKGEPGRSYVRKGLVWELHKKPDKAVMKIKKQASKLGADAIIHFTVQAPTVYGWAVSWATNDEARQAEEAEDVRIMFGKPNRPYEELGPVWQSHDNINKALAKLKKMARKKGADAVIEFKIGSYDGVRYSDAGDSYPPRFRTAGLLAWDTWNGGTSTSSTSWQGPTGGDVMFDPQPPQFKTDAPTQMLMPRPYTIPTLQGVAVKWRD